MTTQHSDPSPERTDTRSEVLSDATDLDALLEAILGDEVSSVAAERPPDEVTAPAAAHARPPDAVTAPAEAADAPPAPPEAAHAPPALPVAAHTPPPPSVVPPPLTAVDPEHALPRGATDDDGAWGFVSEDAQQGNEIARDFSAAPQPAPAPLVPPVSRRTWREKLGVSFPKQSLIVAALLAAALITASAISLRDQPTKTQTLPTPETPALVQSSAPAQSTSAVTPTDSSEVEVWAAAREPEKQPTVISRTSPRRVNEATVQRTSPPTAPAFVAAPLNAPTPSPVVASPVLAEQITAPTDRDAAPSRTAAPEAEPRTLVDSPPTVAPNGASATNGAAPAPNAVAPPVPAGSPSQTAPRLLTGSAPEYPAALRTARIGGSVEVRFTIDRSGRVINVQSVSGPLQLRAAAEAAVRRWRYEAARVDQLAVETQTSVRFNFDPSMTRRPQE